MLTEHRNELTEELVHGLGQCVERIKSDFSDKSVYAFVVYPSSGFRDLGIAFSTREDLPEPEAAELDSELAELLKDHPDLLAKAAGVPPSSPVLDASRWKFVSMFSECFQALNERIQAGYDELYDNGLASDQISQFFSEFITEALATLKSNGVFSGRPFEADVYLGIQFPDSCSGSISIKASENLNSKQWHAELLRLT